MRGMKKVKKRFLCIFTGIFVLFSILQMSAYADESIIDFPDTNLKAALLSSAVDTGGDGEISTSEAEAVTSLTGLAYCGISDISGLEYFTNLETLYLHCNNISDISPLANLTSLKLLVLMDNDIRDISPLLSLTNITTLYLSDNNHINDSSINNGVYVGKISADDCYPRDVEVWTYPGMITSNSVINETNLNGSYIEVELNPFVNKMAFLDDSLDKENFILDAPLSLSIDRVEYIDSKHARVYFLHDGSDIDNFKLTIKGTELVDSSLELTFKDDLPLDIVDDDELIVVKSDGEIAAGQEDGEVLTVNIYGGQFAQDINPDNWSISNLPDGVAKGTVSRVDDTTVDMVLNGNSTGGYDIDTINLTVSCTVDEYLDSTGGTTLTAVLVNDDTAPTVLSFTPTDTEVDYNPTLQMNFSEKVITGSGDIKIFKSSDNSLVETIPITSSQISGSGTEVITITPSIKLDDGTIYYIQIDDTCFKDVYDNYYDGIADETSWRFATYISFPDANLEKALKYADVDENNSGKISVDEAANRKIVGLSKARITNLAGMEHFISLEQLNLSENRISDLSLLANLTSLKKLVLDRNEVSDFTPLSGLTSLKELSISNNKVSDLTPLAHLSSLAELDLSFNNISDLTPLSGLPSLTTLRLSANHISDLTPLSGLLSLEVLSIQAISTNDLRPLSGLVNLKKLYLQKNNITDLRPLAGLTSLKKLHLYNNDISDLTPLSGLASLEYLHLADNQLSNLTPLSGLTSLTYLHLSSNNISYLDPLKGLINLNELYLGSNSGIGDISPLKDLTSLTILDLYHTNISDLTPLSGLTSLNTLYLGGNEISDIIPLSNLMSLVHLGLGDNNISDISSVSKLNNLDYLDLTNNNISDIRPLLSLTTLLNSDRFCLYLNDNPLYNKDTKNAIYLGDLADCSWLPIWVPAGFIKGSSGMTESELDDASIDLEIYPTTFLADSSLDPANFILENVPSGVRIERVDYIDENECRVNLAFDGTDFTTDYTDLKLKIKAVELADDIYGYTYSADNNTQLVFEDDMPNIGADETAPDGYNVSFDEEIINDSEKNSVSFTFTDAEVNTNYDFTITSSEGETEVTGSGLITSAGQTVSDINVSDLNNGTLTLSVILTDSFGLKSKPVTDTALLLTPEEQPTIQIDYVNEKLIEFIDGGTYTVNGAAVNPDDGAVAIESSWLGTELSIVKKGNGTTTMDSTVQTLAVPARPNAPSTPIQISKTANSITITNASDFPNSEYSKDGTSWQDSATFTSLRSGMTYTIYVRAKATDHAFRSDPAEVAITTEGTVLGIGTISGTVTDESAANISGATVKVTKHGTEGEIIATQTTDGDGKFTFSKLTYGVYSLVITKDDKIVTKTIMIDKSSVTQDVVLLSGNKDTVVIVKGATPPVAADNLDKMFTADDITTAKTDTVEIKLVVEKEEESNLDSTEKAKVKEKISSGKKVGIYLDAQLIKTITAADTITKTENIQPPEGQTVNITIDIPAELQNKAPYSIIRVHDGVANILETQYNSILHTITFGADKFSTYAIAYTDDTRRSSRSSRNDDRYTIIANAEKGGMISPSGDVSVRKWQNETFSITAKEGYIIKDVLVDERSVGAIKSYTFEAVKSGHTIKAIFEEDTATSTSEIKNPFEDIIEEDWFYNDILEVYKKGFMQGISENKFDPNLGTSRGMIATIAYRLDGTTEKVDSKFVDVAKDQYYYTPIGWAEKYAVVKGYGNGMYGPNDTITREQLVAILWRYAGSPMLMDYEGLTQFSDASEISKYAQAPMAWAYEKGIISGKGNNILDPKGLATRAEVAKIIVNFMNANGK